MTAIHAVLYVCPRCGNYFGSSNAGDLQNYMNTDVKNAPTFSRAQCPDCRAEGVEVDRLAHNVELHIIGKEDYDSARAPRSSGKDVQVRGSAPSTEP